MIEIIPNWHPLFVHFTIALLTISTLLYVAGLFFKKENLLIVARWNLWIGVTITVGTLLAGLYAYNTVAHDAPSHVAMTNHRNWALVTASIFVLLALWALWKQRGARTVSPVFVVAMVAATGLLFITGYKGGDVVYRYGLGVLSTPDMRNHNQIVHSNDADPRTDEVKSTEVPIESHEQNHGDHHH
jgi:uncharacterized membrane protein